MCEVITMTAISLKLSAELAQESKLIANKIGISRTEFIRQAIRHEVKEIKSQYEREAMKDALTLMRTDSVYLQQAESICEDLQEKLPEDSENWWQG